MRKGAKIAIIVLSVLLILSVTALVVVLIYYKNHFSSGEESLRGNVISGKENTYVLGGGTRTDLMFDAASIPVRSLGAGNRTILFDDKIEEHDVELELNSLNPEENQSFHVDNMFPGDSYTRYYRLNVSYYQKVEVLFRAIPHEGYEFLANRLDIRVYLETTGEELYSGRMADFTSDVMKELTHKDPGTEELLYKITVSLDTSAGNEYQDKETWIRFEWSVKDKGDLIPPQTGIEPVFIYVIVSVLAVVALLLVIVVWKRKRRQKESES